MELHVVRAVPVVRAHDDPLIVLLAARRPRLHLIAHVKLLLARAQNDRLAAAAAISFSFATAVAVAVAAAAVAVAAVVIVVVVTALAREVTHVCSDHPRSERHRRRPLPARHAQEELRGEGGVHNKWRSESGNSRG